MIEDYVSFETSKLLKEKGFVCKKESITAMYGGDGEFYSLSTADPYHFNWGDFDENDYIAPTLQTAIKWLIEVHKLHIELTPYPHEDGVFYWAYKIAFLDSDTLAVMVVREKAGFDSKEKACEEAIKYCLENLI